MYLILRLVILQKARAVPAETKTIFPHAMKTAPSLIKFELSWQGEFHPRQNHMNHEN